MNTRDDLIGLLGIGIAALCLAGSFGLFIGSFLGGYGGNELILIIGVSPVPNLSLSLGGTDFSNFEGKGIGSSKLNGDVLRRHVCEAVMMAYDQVDKPTDSLGSLGSEKEPST